MYFTVRVNKDTGKTEIILTKEQADQQWSSLGKHLEKHNKLVKAKEQGRGPILYIFIDTN